MDKKKITENWIKHKTKQMAEKVPYSTVCGCNPANGGSGMCGCVIGNQMVDPDLYKRTNFDYEIKPFTDWLNPPAGRQIDSYGNWITKPLPEADKQLEEFNEYLHMLADMKTVNLKRKKKLLAHYLNNL